MKVFKIEYFFCGDLAKSVVVAHTMQEAIEIVDGDNVTHPSISKCEQVSDKGIVLTWHQP